MIRFLYHIIFLLIWACCDANCSPQAVIIRHGESTHNVLDVYNSNPNHPLYCPSNLTEIGKVQVRETAKYLLNIGFNDNTIQYVYSSPLPRTIQTAEVLADAGLFSHKKIVEDPLLIEIQMGDLENQPKLISWHDSYYDQFHVETDEQVSSRMSRFLFKLLSLKPTGHVIIITHGMLADTLVFLLTNVHRGFATGEAKIFPLNP